MKTLSVQVPSQSLHTRPQAPITNQSIPAPMLDIGTTSMGPIVDLPQDKSPCHSTTSDIVHQLSDKLYNKLIAQVTGAENEFPLNAYTDNPIMLTKQIPGFRQYPFVRFLLYTVI